MSDIEIRMPEWARDEDGVWHGRVMAVSEARGIARGATVELTQAQYADEAYRAMVEFHLRDSLMASFPEAEGVKVDLH